MPEPASNGVVCPACGARYRWKPELAGQTVRCRCGRTFTMPDAMPALHSDAGAPLDLNVPPADPPPPRCPSCGFTLRKGAVICLNCGYDLARGRPLTTSLNENDPTGTYALPTAPPDDLDALPDAIPLDDDDETDATPAQTRPNDEPDASLLLANEPTQGSPAAGPLVPKYLARTAPPPESAYNLRAIRWNQFYLPLTLLVLGVAGHVLACLFLFVGEPMAAVAAAATLIALQLFITVPMLLGVIFFIASLLRVGFGSLPTAVFKLAAVAIGPGALADAVFLLAAPILMYAMCEGVLALGFLLYILTLLFVGFPMSRMFDLDLHETMATSIVVTILKGMFMIFGVPYLVSLLPASFMHGLIS